MALTLHPIFFAILAIFGVFAIGMGYGCWMTSDVVAPGARDHRT